VEVRFFAEVPRRGVAALARAQLRILPPRYHLTRGAAMGGGGTEQWRSKDKESQPVIVLPT
jgi:hypothetical protein